MITKAVYRLFLLELYNILGLGFLLNCFVEKVDHPLGRVRNRDVEPDVVVLPDLADLLIIFLAKRDLLKVLDDAVCSPVKAGVNVTPMSHCHRPLTLLYRLGDHRVAARHSPCNKHLRGGHAEPVSHLLHFGVVYQLPFALYCPSF
jgi:hypothetical protein